MKHQLHDYQIYAKEFIKTRNSCALWLEMGLGKAIDDETVIPTPDGFRKVKEIQIGDRLFGKNGTPCIVEKIFKHPNKTAYRVTLSDHRSFICCDEHLVPFQSYTKAKIIQHKPLSEMIPDYKQTTSQGYTKYKYRIPMNDAVEYPAKRHFIRPYSLGVLIGDGCLCETTLIISSIDEDVIQKFAKLQNISPESIKKSKHNYNWAFTHNKNADNIRKELKRLQLRHKKSVEKFIPEEYFIDSIENRKQLLIGLLDTDGNIHVSHKNDKNANHSISYSFSTMSDRLADDVCRLCWSLGFAAQKSVYYKKDGSVHEIRVGIGATEQLIFCERKTKGVEFKFNTKRTKHTPIIDITRVENRDMTCFTVSSEDHLFLINDYIVTHNSLTTLSALAELNPKNHVLIVAPLNIARATWVDEIEKWGFPFRYKSLIVNEKGNKLSKKKRYELYEALPNEPPTLYFINRDLFADLVDWSLSKKPAIWYFPIIVLDEAQSFKSHSSQRFKAMQKILPATSKIIELTGTPQPRSVEDLWAQIYLLDHGARLGKNITQFRNVFCNPVYNSTGKPVFYRSKMGAEEEIHRRIQDIVISMKNTVLSLPELIINHVPIEMDPSEKDLYKELMREFVLEIDGTEVTAANAGVLYIKLAQMASGAIYTTPEKDFSVIHKKKLEMTQYIIEQTDSPVIIAYHFQSDKKMLMDYLTKQGLNPTLFDGSPNMIKDWNENKIPILLLQPASAGHGLNLQSGNGHTLIWYSLPSSLEEYLQCNARLYRQGQTQNVVIHILKTKGTVDMKIWDNLVKKELSQEDLMEAVRIAINE